MKQEIIAAVERIGPELCRMADDIFDHPETGLSECYVSTMLCDYLSEHGFLVERGIGDMPTAFRAQWHSGDSSGPSIGFLCEYDALEDLGHACGHHAQGPAILGAAIALQESLLDRNYNLVIYGTPAEETVGGKVLLLDKGYFRDIEVALMMHLSPTTCVDDRSRAMRKYLVSFFGQSSHAAIQPESGRSALDALVLMLHGIECLREHVPEDVRIHYSILNGGGPANCVPAFASGSFYLRSYHEQDLEMLERRFSNIAEGAALMTDTKCSIQLEKKLLGKVPVKKLNDRIMEYAKDLNAPLLSPPRKTTGSSDFNNVQHLVPGTCLRIHFVPPGTSPHSQQYLDAGKSDKAHQAIILSAEILALTACDLICQPKLLEEIRAEHREQLNLLKL